MSTANAEQLAKLQEQQRRVFERRALHQRALDWALAAFPDRGVCHFAAWYALEDMKTTGAEKPRRAIVAEQLAKFDARYPA